MAKWTEAERAIAKRKIEQYKVIRPLVQQGVLYRLISPFEENKCALQYNNTDNTADTVLCYNLAEYLPGSQFASRSSTMLKFKGLNGNQLYEVKNLDESEKSGMTYKGDFLKNIGIAWPLKGANKSQVLLVTGC